MRNRALIIGPGHKALIDAAVAAARASPVRWETFRQLAEGIDQETTSLALKDRPPNFKPANASQHVLIPIGFRAAISFEEQPAGLVRHLSISVESKTGGMPNPQQVLAIAGAFGFTLPAEGLQGFDRVWTEEYEPGRWAINVLQLDQEREAPTETRQ